MPAGTLTSKQRSFVTALVHENQTKTKSAIIAGYTPQSASGTARDLLALPKIQAAVAAERASYAIASGVTKKMVVDGLMEAVDMAKIKADPLAMIAGWREVGKMLGFYEPTKVSMSVTVGGQVLLSKMNTMSDAELLAEIAEIDLTNPDSIVSDQ
jgi:phage terminase small subunit